MPSFYDLLKYAKTGIASSDMTYYDKMRALAMAGAKYPVRTITGVPPLSFKSDGSPLISWSMVGNGQQTGTPSPDNIIMPTFCGVRTGNLWNEKYTGINETFVTYQPIFVGNGYFTLSSTCKKTTNGASLFILPGNVSSGASTINNGVSNEQSRTCDSIDGYITVGYRGTDRTYFDPRNEQTMLNVGTTALPYEPYGWKLSLTSAGQTTPVYLGQVQTVRRIKKLVLDGTEAFGYANNCFTMSFDGKPAAIQPIKAAVISNAYQGQEPVYRDQLRNYQCCITIYFNQLAMRDDNYTEIADFKSYLAQQYAAGTPVTVWYALEEPETAIVNEPLCKIGNYADELHSEDAGVTIPTARGVNTLTVESELQPSEMSITGHIKPV